MIQEAQVFPVGAEPSAVIENHQLSLQQRAGLVISRLGLAAVCAIPVADIATSDTVTAHALTYLQEEIDVSGQETPLSDHLVETLAVDAIISLGIIGQCVVVTSAIKKSKRLSESFDDFEAYTEIRQAEMTGPRKLVSKIANAPLSTLGKVGEKTMAAGEKLKSGDFNTVTKLGNFALKKAAEGRLGPVKLAESNAQFLNWAGEKILNHDFKLLRKAGPILIDTGKVNLMGPPMAFLSEQSNGENPSFKRLLRLSGLFGATWVGVAEGIRQVYRQIPATQIVLRPLGRALDTATSISLDHPLSTPWGTGVIMSVLLMFGANGWNLARFQEQKNASKINI